MGFRSQSLVLAFLLSWPFLVHGSNCSTIDYSHQFGPVRNQRNLHWCFAFAAADLLSYRLKADNRPIRGDGSRITDFEASAMPFAMDYLMKTSRGMHESALGKIKIPMQLAIQATLSNPKLCSEQDIPSVGGTANAFLSSVWDGQLSNFGRALLPEMDFPSGTSLSNEACKLKPGSPHLMRELGSAFQQALRQTYQDERRSRCATTTHSMKLKDEDHWTTSRMGSPIDHVQRIGASVDRILESGNVPLISYFYSYVRNRTIDGESGHAGVIVGRKLIDGVCHYRLRNTWGPDCSPRAYPERYLPHCDKGYIYISEMDLFRTVHRINYLE